MFCTKCGSNVAEGVKFCTECGNPVAQPAVSAGQAPAPITAVCDEKGNLLSKLTYDSFDNPSRYVTDTHTENFYHTVTYN